MSGTRLNSVLYLISASENQRRRDVVIIWWRHTAHARYASGMLIHFTIRWLYKYSTYFRELTIGVSRVFSGVAHFFFKNLMTFLVVVLYTHRLKLLNWPLPTNICSKIWLLALPGGCNYNLPLQITPQIFSRAPTNPLATPIKLSVANLVYCTRSTMEIN